MFHSPLSEVGWTLEDWNIWLEYARHPLLTHPGLHSIMSCRINAYLNGWEKSSPELGIRNKMFDGSAYLEDLELEREIAKLENR